MAQSKPENRAEFVGIRYIMSTRQARAEQERFRRVVDEMVRKQIKSGTPESACLVLGALVKALALHMEVQ